jgi:hypothetical protein
VIVVLDSFAHRASNASDSCVSLPPFSWASLVSNKVHWRFAIYVPWHRTGTYLVTDEGWNDDSINLGKRASVDRQGFGDISPGKSAKKAKSGDEDSGKEVKGKSPLNYPLVMPMLLAPCLDILKA